LDAGDAFWYDSIIQPVRDQGSPGTTSGHLHLRHRRIDGPLGDSAIDEEAVEMQKILDHDADRAGPALGRR